MQPAADASASLAPFAAPRERHRALIAAGTIVFLLLAFLIYASGYAVAAGFQIPQEDLPLDYLMGVMWALVLGLFIASLPVGALDKQNLLIAWLAKCYVCLILMLPYEQRYELDCFSYFYGMRWYKVGWVWEPNLRSRLAVVMVGWYQDHLLMDSYHAIKMTFAFIGLAAIYLVYRAAVAVVGFEESPVLLYFALFPSILFWSSIIGKDPIVFLGVALYVFGVVKWRSTHKSSYLILFAVGMVISTIMRVWLGIILGAPLLYFAIRGVKGFMARIATIVVCAILIPVMLSQFTNAMNVASADDIVNATDRVASQFSKNPTGASGSTREAPGEVTSIAAMVAFIPLGVFTVLFRPLPGEVNNAFGLMAGLENTFLLWMTIRCVRVMIRNRKVRRPLLREPVIIWTIVFVVFWCWSYGFISVQNLGASVRFRLPIITVYFALLLAVRWAEVEVKKRRKSQEPEPEPVAPAPMEAQPAGA